jgi:hypothetical protein
MPGKRFWLRLVGVLVVIIVSVTAFFVFYHPPMRLMPPPLLWQDAALPVTDMEAALTDGARIEVFYGSNRLPIGPADARIYTVAPDRRLHLGRATLRIGDEGSTFDQILEWSTRAEVTDRPFLHLERMQEYASLPVDGISSDPVPAPQEDVQVWFDEINALLAQSRNKDVLLYVHGANTTVERAAGQAAMLRHFTGRNAVVVVFVWPTAENFLRYSRDIQTAYGAAPRLTELMSQLADHTDAEKINVFTYSAGATVGTDALALLAETRPDAADLLGEVYHAAPDADFRGFVDDLSVYADAADRVTTAVNFGDSALRLAGAVNRASRAGRPDISELSPEAAAFLFDAARTDGLELLRVRPENHDGMSVTSHTFWYDDPWVSNDVLLTLLFHLSPAGRGLDTGVTEAGAPYWTFSPDHPGRMEAVGTLARQQFLSSPGNRG